MRQNLAVLSGFRCCAGLKTTAIDPNHDPQMCIGRCGGGPNVQIETVFAWSVIPKHHVGENGALHAAGSKLGGLANSLPRLSGLRRLPPEISNRGRCKRDALVDADLGV